LINKNFSTKDFAVATYIKNCANQQSIVIIRSSVLKINSFLEWSIVLVSLPIKDRIKPGGFKRGDKSIFYFLKSGRGFFSYEIFFQQD